MMSRPFDLSASPFPVTGIVPELRQHLAAKNTLVLTAPPGAGKSTILPLALLDEPWLAGRKIIVLEPRRLAASSIANRMAQLLGEETGETVGYRIRFDTRVSRETRIEVVTEGILTRMLHGDNALEEVGLLIFDEFHERNIHADIALAFTRQVQEVLRPDLRILVMSATLDADQLAGLLQAPVIESQGKMFPVDIIYTGEQDIYQLPQLAARTVSRAIREKEGDVLVFLPGQAEITTCAELLKGTWDDVGIFPLYGELSYAEQQAALLPDPGGRRKIVLATSIAETSLTITGVKVVVDAGFTRKSVFDPGTGLSGLRTVPISIDAADQRAGRAGRLTEGTCYRMWSAATHQRLAPYRTPEILDSDLSPLLLDLLEWGVNDASGLSWLDQPPATAIAAAKSLLQLLGAMEGDKITDHGRKLHRIPSHPRLANLLLRASEMDAVAHAADIAALLEERDPLDRLRAGADIHVRLEGLHRYRTENSRDRNFQKIEKTAKIYRKLFNARVPETAPSSELAGLLLAYAYPERIALAREGKTGHFLMANGQMAVIDREDPLAHERWLSIAQLDARGNQGKIFLAAQLDPTDLLPFAREKSQVRWDSRKGQLLATTDRLIGSLVLQSRPLTDPDPRKLEEALIEAVRTDGRSLLPFTDEVEQWQNRVLSLRHWNPGQDWPDVSTEILLRDCQDWLGPYFPQLRKAEDFKKIKLADVLQHALDYQKQTLLQSLAPAVLAVPSGSAIPLRYSPYGENPVLAVRLQELFGLLDTPTVNGGTMKVIIHLLSPGYKPVQVTTDLRSFWDNTYFEVRKELKRRYPKHAWPENPREAEAVRGVKKKS